MDELEPTEPSLRTFFAVIRRRFPWLLAVTVLGVAVGVAYVGIQKKEYSATAQMLVQPSGGSVSASGVQQAVSQTQVLNELQLITNAPVKDRVTKKLGHSPEISAVEVGQTDVINLTATAHSPVLAARVANIYATTFVAYQRTNALNVLIEAEQQLELQISAIDAQLKALEAQTSPSASTTSTISALVSQEAALKGQLSQFQITGSETPGGIEVVSPANAPTSPSSPKPLRDGAIALAAGLVLGLGAEFVAEYFDDKVYTKDEAERLSGGVPVLAIVPLIKDWKKPRRPFLITKVDPYSTATEAYRTLRTSLQFVARDAQLKTILVTSASGAEGKTSSVANLGVVLANAGERVIVVDCDLRRPRLAGFFGEDESVGFTSVLLGEEELKNAIRESPDTPTLALLGTGPIPPNPADLLGSDKAAELFQLLAANYDVVLIDSPPVLPVADPLVIARYSDAVLMVVMVGLTTRAQVERASELLAQVDARPAGIVLNKATRRSTNLSGYGYGYKYSHTPLAPIAIQDGNGVRPSGSEQQQRKTGSRGRKDGYL